MNIRPEPRRPMTVDRDYSPAILTALRPLKTPPFGRLLASYTVNQLGDYIGLVALAVLVYRETGDPLATTALFLTAQFLPSLLAPALVARVDQLAVRRALPVIYLLEALCFVALAVLAGSFALWSVLVLALVDGALMLTARALTRAAVNSVLAPLGRLRQGNALINLGFALSAVGGSALGGLLVHELGVGAALWVDAASFMLVALLLATSGRLPAAVAEAREPVLRRLRDGLRHARGDRLVRLLLGGEALALVLFTLIVPIEIVYAKETLETTDAGYGLLLSAWGLGVVLGSLVYLRVSGRSPAALVLGSTAVIGLAYLGMAAVDELLLACLLSVLGGLGNGIQWVSVMTLLQEHTPEAMQARMVGLLESVGSATTGAGYVLGGAIVVLASPPVAFAVAGGGIVALVVAMVAARALQSRRRRPASAPLRGSP